MRFFSTSNAIVIPTPLNDLEQGTTNESCRGGKNILAVTNFNFRRKTKALEQAILATADLLEQHPDWTFRIAGSGPHMESVRVAIRENNIDSISMLGYVENVDELYRNADIFVHFSYLDAYPSTVIEASAHRLPVVTNRGFGMSDQIIDGQNGFIVDLNDSKELRSKLRLLMNSKCERLKMGENARSMVEKNNSLQAIGEQFHQYLVRSL